jgi:hypothetical protein
MDKLEKYEILKTLYFTQEKRRTRIFTEFFELFDIENHPIYKNRVKSLSKLELQADFCIALDKCLKKNPQPEKPLKTLAWMWTKEIRKDMEFKRGIQTTMKSEMRLHKDPSVKGMKREEVNLLKVTQSIESIKMGNQDPFFAQEIEAIKEDIKNFLVEKFGVKTYYDFMDHYVHGESFQDMAYFDRDQHSRQAIHKRLSKAWKSLSSYLADGDKCLN